MSKKRKREPLPAPQPDPAWDLYVAEMIAYFKAKQITAHTRRGQTFIVNPRQPRRSRLTGAPR